MAFVNYIEFKKEIFHGLTNKEKNYLFYWSLFDSSVWEEVNDYFPNIEKGHKRVIKILKRSEKIKKLILKDSDYFVKVFLQGEFLSNYLLAAELEKHLDNTWKLDVNHIQGTSSGDAVFQNNKHIVTLEIKGILSAADLMGRIQDEVVPHLGKESYTNFILLLLFPACRGDNLSRINQLIKGYYIYEEILVNGSRLSSILSKLLSQCNPFANNLKNRQVFCQCFTDKVKDRIHDYTLENLSERIEKKYFEKF